MTDNWMDSASGPSSPRKGEQAMSAMEYYVRKNISEENIMEKLVENESDKNRSILFASKTLCIRKNLYYILARSIKVIVLHSLTLIGRVIDWRGLERVQLCGQADPRYSEEPWQLDPLWQHPFGTRLSWGEPGVYECDPDQALWPLIQAYQWVSDLRPQDWPLEGRD